LEVCTDVPFGAVDVMVVFLKPLRITSTIWILPVCAVAVLALW